MTVNAAWPSITSWPSATAWPSATSWPSDVAHTFATDLGILAWHEPDSGFVDLAPVANSPPFGALTTVSGAAVPITAGVIDGHSCYTITRKTTGTNGYLKSTTVPANAFNTPVHLFFVARFTGAPTVNVRMFSSASGGCSLNYSDGTHMVMNGGADLSFATTPTNFHYFRCYFHGNFSYVSVDGGAYVQGNVSTGGTLNGLAFGARGSDGALSSDCDIAFALAYEGPASSAFETSLGAHVKSLFPSLGLPSTFPTIGSELSASPALWTPGNPWDAIIVALSQSNASNFATAATSGFNSSIYELSNATAWVAAANPWDSSTNQTDEVSIDSVATTGSFIGTLANQLQEAYNRPLALVPCAKSASWVVPGAGTTNSTWERSYRRGRAVRNSLYWSSVFRAREVIHWGGTIRALVIMQGEAEAANASSAIRAAWPATMDALIALWWADVGLPNPADNLSATAITVLQQIAQKAGNATWIDFQTNVVPTIRQNAKQVLNPTPAGVTFEADGIHWDGASMDKLGPKLARAVLGDPTGLVLRMSAETADTTVAAGIVTNASDRSGSGNALAQATAGKRPTYLNPSTHFNARNSIAFDGATIQWLDCNSVASSFSGTAKPFSFIAAIQMPGGTLGVSGHIVSLSSSGTVGKILWGLGTPVTGNAPLSITIQDDAGNTFQTSTSTRLSDTAAHIVSIVSDGSSVSIWIDGVATSVAGKSTAPIAGTITLDQAAIGAFSKTGTTGYTGEMARVHMYSRALTTGERQTIENRWKAFFSIP